MIDEEANFDNHDAAKEVLPSAKFRPKKRGKPQKASLSSKSAASNPTLEIKDRKVSHGIVDELTEDVRTVPLGLSQDDEHNNHLSKLATHQESLVVSDILVSPATSCGKTIEDIVESGEASSSKVAGTNDNVAAPTPMVRFCADNNDMWTKLKDKETITGPATWSPQDVQTAVDLDPHNELMIPHTHGTQSMFEEISAEPTVTSQPNVGREKGKGKSVSFVLPDDSEGVSVVDINSEMGDFNYSCNDSSNDENLNSSPQQTAEKQYTDKVNQSHEREPAAHAVEQQSKSDVGEAGSSMKLRCRKKLQKVGIPEHTADDYFDEDNVESLAAEQDNDSGDEYIAGGKRKVRRMSGDGINKEPLRDSMCVEGTHHQKVKSRVSSRGHKRTLKGEVTEKPEKKLTHRIRQKRMKEIKTLLERPYHEINHKQLSAADLRLLQEARERVNAKQIPSGPSSNTSSQFEDFDDTFEDDEAENFDDDRTDNNVIQNATKLNYHSYMNKQTRAKWSKSDTDLFYQGLRQFGSDFAMIQQLFPDKTRHQVRQKFKSEEKKNPMLVHDAIIHRSRDNVYFKKVIKQLDIEDVLPETNNTCKQDNASNEGGPGNENALGNSIDDEEENGSSWSDKEHGTLSPDVQQEHIPGNADDDLGDVFDWY